MRWDSRVFGGTSAYDNEGYQAVLLQVISLAGAALILAAYVANQRGWTGPARMDYNVANLAGALLLGWVAVADRRLGFILLEVVWALVSIPPLIGLLRAKEGPAS